MSKIIKFIMYIIYNNFNPPFIKIVLCISLSRPSVQEKQIVGVREKHYFL